MAKNNNIIYKKFGNDEISNIKKLDQTYEGKAKILYKTNHDDMLISYFKDDVTAFNKGKTGIINNKGIINNYISSFIMERLSKAAHINNHFIKRLNDNEQLIAKVDIIPLEVIIRNTAAGSFSKRFGIEEGTPLEFPVIEFCVKNDELGDPFVTEDSVIALNIVTSEEIDILREEAMRVNYFLTGLFAAIDIKLIDFKLEFGFDNMSNEIIVADEISPDSCRLWDLNSGNRMDKDLFRRDLGDLMTGYKTIAERFNIKLPF